MATPNLYKVVKTATLKGQALNVYNAALKVGRPFKVADLVPILDNDKTFSTTQTTERIAAYYVCVLKKAHVFELATVDDSKTLSEFYSEWESEVGITR